MLRCYIITQAARMVIRRRAFRADEQAGKCRYATIARYLPLKYFALVFHACALFSGAGHRLCYIFGLRHFDYYWPSPTTGLYASGHDMRFYRSQGACRQPAVKLPMPKHAIRAAGRCRIFACQDAMHEMGDILMRQFL